MQTKTSEKKSAAVTADGSAVAPTDIITTQSRTAQKEAEIAAEFSSARLGIHTPSLPGDIHLVGYLPSEAIAGLAKSCAGWLYLNKPDDPNFHRVQIEAAGLRCEVVPFFPPKIDENDVLAMKAAINALPRPLMIQCKSGSRAGAAMLLWLAHQRGYSANSAAQLAVDLDLKFYTNCVHCGPVRDWLFGQLPAEGDAIANPMVGADAILQQLFDPVTSTFTYIIGCRDSGESLLIDPVLEKKNRDLKRIDELGFTLKYVLNTHCHADHVTSGGKIRTELPEVKTVISESSGAKADIYVHHGEEIELGKLKLEVRATPGHTDGCVTYVLRIPEKPPMCFTGDALLIRGCGRTDLQQGDAGKLYDNVHQQIFSLPPETLIYPGHDYKGCNVSTVGEERRFNERLTKTREEFVDLMANLALPYPKIADVAVPANMACGVQG